MPLTPREKKLFAAWAITLSIGLVMFAVGWRRVNQTLNRRLSYLMAERVVWKCEACPPSLLVPATGQSYQPRNWTKLQDFPTTLVDSVIAVEDRRFYSHPGIDLIRTCGALFIALKNHEGPRGTSTLTQQLSRIMFTSNERTLSRKVHEAIFAIALELHLTKQEILELYLNTVPFGNAGPYQVIGVADASKAFLGRPPSELKPADIALIVGTIQRPSNLSSRNKPSAAAHKRRDLVLKLMRIRGVISESAEQEARRTPVRLAELQSSNAHYLQLAARELGRTRVAGEPLEATLTLDARLQQAALDAIQRGTKRLNRRSGTQVEAALVAVDPRTGAVRALVGGTNFFSSQVNRALSQRQPGSVFKPFVYAAAFEHDPRSGELGPYSEVNDVPREFTFRGEPYLPRNFGDTYHGRVTLQQALLQSLNVPAVRLAELVGYARVADLAKTAGLEGVASTPSAALGSYEVSPLALAGAYTAFANQGIAVKPYFIERVRDWKGNVLREAPVQETRVMRTETAQILADMLRGVVQYGTAWEAGRLPFAAAGKTGTDDDGWFAGFTDSLVCVVWVGYDDNRNLGLEGARSALPIWIDFMRAVHGMKAHQFADHLKGPPARMDRAMYPVDPPLPPDFDLDEEIANVDARRLAYTRASTGTASRLAKNWNSR